MDASPAWISVRKKPARTYRASDMVSSPRKITIRSLAPAMIAMPAAAKSTRI